MSLKRKTLKNINEEELKMVNGASISNGGNYWEVRDDTTNKLVGTYKSKDFAKWADEQYRNEGKVSYFGYIPRKQR